MVQPTGNFSEGFAARLAQDYGPDIAGQLDIGSWQSAPLAYAQDKSISYVRLVSGDVHASRPVLYVNGVNAGIIAGAPFAADLASRGFDVLLADQNRAPLPYKHGRRPDATHAQAEALASIITTEKLTEQPLNLISHSYGSLVVQALHGIAEKNGWATFRGSRVAMLAPAGMIEKDSPAHFLHRYRKHMHPVPSAQFPDGYQEFRPEMSRAGERFMRENKKRSFRESFDSVFRKVLIQKMLKAGVAEFMVFIFAEDELYSEEAFEKTIKHNTIEGLSFASPVSVEPFDGGIRSGLGARHSDQQFNPARSGDAVEQFLRAA